MARVLINDLPEQTVLEPANFVVVQDGTDTKKMTVARITDSASTALNDHLVSTSAHLAGAIPATPSAQLTGASVQAQLDEASTLLATVAADADAATTAVNDHIADATAAHAASAVSATATTPLTGTTAQALFDSAAAVIVANQNNLAAHLSDADAAHQATAIACAVAGLVATQVQAALAELLVMIQSKWTMWQGSQAAYDALGTKDPNTLYVITA